MARTPAGLTYPVPGLSSLTVLWFIVTSFVVVVDALFVLWRPYTLTAKELPWSVWQTYILHDKRYAAMEDPFVILQSQCNLVEVALQLLAVVLNFSGRTSVANKVAFLVSTMTLYKTVIYFGMEHHDGYRFTKHNSPTDLLLMVVIPSTFWIVVPAIVLMQSWSRLAKGEQILHLKR